jgi:CopG family nickel-responsive transcriptional regulator
MIRFSTTIDPKLLKKFDEILRDKGYTNRSEGIRDLIRNFVVQHEWKKEKGEVIGSLTLLYEHDVRGVTDKLTELQHSYRANVLSSMHVHLDERNCLEVLIIKGNPMDVKKISNTLIASRGVKHGELTMSSTGKEL